jgi:hypothetical protein
MRKSVHNVIQSATILGTARHLQETSLNSLSANHSQRSRSRPRDKGRPTGNLPKKQGYSRTIPAVSEKVHCYEPRIQVEMLIMPKEVRE